MGEWVTQEHPLTTLAAATGYDRMTLSRAMAAAGKKKGTIADAVSIMSRKSEDSLNRSRKMKAEAEGAEITAAKEKGTLMLTENAVRWAREYATKARVVIMSFKVPEAEKKRGCADLAKIQLSE